MENLNRFRLIFDRNVDADTFKENYTNFDILYVVWESPYTANTYNRYYFTVVPVQFIKNAQNIVVCEGANESNGGNTETCGVKISGNKLVVESNRLPYQIYGLKF